MVDHQHERSTKCWTEDCPHNLPSASLSFTFPLLLHQGLERWLPLVRSRKYPVRIKFSAHGMLCVWYATVSEGVSLHGSYQTMLLLLPWQEMVLQQGVHIFFWCIAVVDLTLFARPHPATLILLLQQDKGENKVEKLMAQQGDHSSVTITGKTDSVWGKLN